MSAATTQMAEVKVATRPTVQAAAGIPSRPGCRVDGDRVGEAWQ